MTEPITFTANARSGWRATAVAGGASLVALLLAITLMITSSNPFLAVGALAVAIIFGWVALVTGTAAKRPLTLTADHGGLAVSARGHTTRLPWESITEVRIIDRGPRESKKGWLAVWLAPGADRPRTRMYLPEWKSEIDGVRVCDLDLLPYPTETIRAAVRERAGTRWNDSSTIR